MSTWGNSWKLSFGGHIATAQGWSTGFWMNLGAVSGTPTQANLDSQLALFQTMLSTWWTALKVYNTSDTTYDWNSMTFYPTGTNKASLISRTTIAGVAGTSSTQGLAPCCAVASLRSSHPGRTGRGRMYVPATGALLNVGGHQFTSAMSSAVATATAALLTSANAQAISFGGATFAVVCINSVRSNANYFVNKVICDSLPDFQDRRQDKLAALTVSSANV